MATNRPEPPTGGGLLARLCGMVQAHLAPMEEKPTDEVLPTWDETPPPQAAPPAEAQSNAMPVATAAVEPGCPHCRTPRNGPQEYCDNCGWLFPKEASTIPPPDEFPRRVNQQYELTGQIDQRGDVYRFRGRGFLSGDLAPLPVVLVRAPVAPFVESVPASGLADALEEAVGELPSLPTDEKPTASLPGIEASPPERGWPGIAWEHGRLEIATHPSLPRVIDRFTEGEYEYLVEELPLGRSLWDAWDDPGSTVEQRYDWLKQVAHALQELHKAGALLDGLRPDLVVVTATGQPRLTELSGMLPLPVPPDAPIRAGYATAPELVVATDHADARADLYGFGAMLCALLLGRELAEMDFEMQGSPKPFATRFPDAHPLLVRLLGKTFCRDLHQRFPTEETARRDPTGFEELIQTLDVCRRTLAQVRFDVAAWTTTGMVRGGNEDAFALLHAATGRQDDLGDAALILLADGMGGYESGEVAAALALQSLRHYLLQQPPFAELTGGPSFWPGREPFDVEACKKILSEALKEANTAVYHAARTGQGKRGMGCTAEAVAALGHHLVVGHVGDSRTYHLHAGNLVQLTRDHTLVNRMFELGHLTEEEALAHPRRSELQQAIGGYPDVDPAVYHATLVPGDWVVVCSDGLSNCVMPAALKDTLQASASAEAAARRLVNLANLEGATDNATIVVLRVT